MMSLSRAKAINRVAGCLLFSFLLTGPSLYSTDSDRLKKMGNESCNLGLDIPDRLSTISRTEKEIVFRDKTSKAVLTFTKVGLADYDFNLEKNAHQVFQEMDDNPNIEKVSIKRKDLSVTECFIVDWENPEKGPNMKNDFSRMALIQICGQYYNFTFSLPSSKKAEVLPVFSQILESVDKITALSK